MSRASRDSASGIPDPIPSRDNVTEALSLMIEALELIDANQGPDDVGAHLDLAIHRLKEWIVSGQAKSATS